MASRFSASLSALPIMPLLSYGAIIVYLKPLLIEDFP
jgi:hypothetical protein